jgi:NADH-quinone oxidoreductase subunit J
VALNLFYFLSFVAVLSALLVVFSKNPVHSVLYLVITFFAIGCHYLLLLNSEFLFAVHIIVYAGAIMVLFLYVIMLLNLNKESEPHHSTGFKLAAAVCSGLLLVVFIGSLRGAGLDNAEHVVIADLGTAKNLGKVLFGEFLLPFEISSVLLLAAMVGAVMLGKSEKHQETNK